MSGGWSRYERGGAKMTEGGCMFVMFGGLAFPFLMYGIANAIAWVFG